MLIDFGKLNQSNNFEGVIDPVQIFDVLPEKNEKYEEYLRDVQSAVLDNWFNNYRDKKNAVIKMNTGSGKTVVGLLILKSYLNEDMGPAVYVVPDNFLVRQVIEEANDLGIQVTDDAKSKGFVRGEQILVTNMHKIINGRSVFGVNELKQEIGCIVIDDAHACIKAAESQFTIRIPSGVEAYSQILNLFSDSIKHQSESRYLEISDGENGVQQLIPYWDWNSNISTVRSILHSHKDNYDYCGDEKSLYFNWSLIKDNLELCNCIITGKEILINLDYLPIETISSFDECPHRVFMSATIDDDSILISHFNIEQSEIKSAVTPKNANDIGERLILIPQEINPNISEDEIKVYLTKLSKKVNVVVLVPSIPRSAYWEDVANVVVKDSSHLVETLEKLKNSHVGLVVLINKYDGIDLPKKACEVLVLDGIPDVRSEFEKYNQKVLRGSQEILKNTIQRIEQGMGRGIRSKDDYCVVFLMGSSLVQNLFNKQAKSYFTDATRQQVTLSKNLFSQVNELQLEQMDEIINYCLSRNKDWVETSRKALVNVKYNNKNLFNNLIVKQREAFNNAKLRDFQGATRIIQELVNSQENQIVKSFLKYKLAKYEYFLNPIQSQQTMLSAKKLNSQLLQPIDGIEYEKLQFNNLSQATKINQYYLSKYTSTNEFVLSMNSIIDKLIFAENTSNQFEQAFKEIGEHLGFVSQRPENDFGKGPDNLWGASNQICFVVECKNEAYTETISKHYCNQLNGSIIWFKNNYPTINTFTPILIHPSSVFEHAASPDPKIRIMNKEKLNLFRFRLRDFTTHVATANYDVTTIASLLNNYKLDSESIIQEFTLPFTVK
ncbi:DEAD/DEAH box helicase family protein [Rummeliibacillus stabekisii]|uniref:DEAD/DEAH box helicase family protein n=1 Tax=Rummeliibacillus stabekisii TaxID=241244 RepID=UPI00203EBD52|nr:DEAD/DEAH box helicase family protein [Rummeliibacillus stabekisii]MCM3317196.1 DEAD/DEAH box helicase family protein [Rummeliibacillus stabekisii]